MDRAIGGPIALKKMGGDIRGLLFRRGRIATMVSGLGTISPPMVTRRRFCKLTRIGLILIWRICRGPREGKVAPLTMIFLTIALGRHIGHLAPRTILLWVRLAMFTRIAGIVHGLARAITLLVTIFV